MLIALEVIGYLIVGYFTAFLIFYLNTDESGDMPPKELFILSWLLWPIIGSIAVLISIFYLPSKNTLEFCKTKSARQKEKALKKEFLSLYKNKVLIPEKHEAFVNKHGHTLFNKLKDKYIA